MERADLQDAAAGAGGFIELGGRTLVVAAPTDRRARELARFLRQGQRTALQEVAAQIQAGLIPAELRAEAVRAAIQVDAGGGSMPTEAGIAERLTELPGVRMLAWVSVRDAHPDLTKEQIDSWVTEANYRDVYDALNRASGMDRLGNSGGPRGSATRARTGTGSTTA